MWQKTIKKTFFCPIWMHSKQDGLLTGKRPVLSKFTASEKYSYQLSLSAKNFLFWAWMQFWLLLTWFHKSPEHSRDQSPAPIWNKPCTSLAVSQLFSHQIHVKFFNHFFGTSLTHGLQDWLSYRFVSFSVCLNTLKIWFFFSHKPIFIILQQTQLA